MGLLMSAGVQTRLASSTDVAALLGDVRDTYLNAQQRQGGALWYVIDACRRFISQRVNNPHPVHLVGG